MSPNCHDTICSHRKVSVRFRFTFVWLSLHIQIHIHIRLTFVRHSDSLSVMIWLSLHIQIYIQTNFTFDIHSLYIQNTFIIHSLYIQFQILIHKISEFDIRYTFSSKFLYIKYHNFIFVIHSVPHSWTKHFPIIYLLYAKIKIFRYNISQLDIRYTFSFRFLNIKFHD